MAVVGAGSAVIASAFAAVGAGSSRIERAFRMIGKGWEDNHEGMRGLHGNGGIGLVFGARSGRDLEGSGPDRRGLGGFRERKGSSARKALRGNSVLLLPSKEKPLHFLGFLWPNRGFSMGYGESK
jgi:hypothetical protein